MEVISPDKERLNSFVLANHGSFQQSWQWGELQGRMNRRVVRYLFLEDGQPRLAGAFVRHDLPMGKYYWLCPKGPVFSKTSPPHEEGLGEVLEAMLTMTPLTSPLMRGEKEGGLAPHEGEKPMFIRIEPEIFSKSKIANLKSKMVKAPKDHNPRATILIDLEKTEGQLFSEMHPKTRYNIRLAEKKGVKIPPSPYPLPPGGGRGGGGEEGVSSFLNLLEKTAKKDKFHLHPRKYYQELLKMPEIRLFGAYLQGGEGGVIAAAMVSFWGDEATYLHGASDYEVRNLMAPYLLHWEIIRQAKARGLKYYDLGGVAPKDEPRSVLSGISRFKTGFGGKYVEYGGSLDYVISPLWYSIYKMARRIL